MLKPEVARDRLKSFANQDGDARRLAAVKKLPKRLREPAQVLANNQPYGTVMGGRDRQQAELRAAQQLDQLSQADRFAIFEALFPSIATQVERSCQLLVAAPYQHHSYRKAFRAPNTPLTTQGARFAWLARLWRVVKGYNQDVAWLAAWAAHLGWEAPDALGILFAAAIDAGGTEGDAVFDILCASARGEHEIGAMGRHVTRGLLLASREEGWEFIERLLLAAQSQEGLRQVILETVDEAHPRAFRRMLGLILDHNLVRFSSTVRAIDVWFGLQWDSAEARHVTQVVASALLLLDDCGARAAALAAGDGRQAYLALWAMAFEDAVATVEPASRLLTDGDVERRFAGTHLLSQLGLVAAQDALLTALDDADQRVVVRVVAGLGGQVDERLGKSDLFERLERVLRGFLRQRQVLKPILWPWLELPADRTVVVTRLVDSLGDRPPNRLIPYLSEMSPNDRFRVTRMLAGKREWDAETRAVLFSLVGDPSNDVRETALRAIAECEVGEHEAIGFERLLTRRASGLRRGVISLLLKQRDEGVLASAERLLEASDLGQCLAGLELLRELKTAKRRPERCRASAERFRSRHVETGDDERRLLECILGGEGRAPTLDDALGLLDPAQRTKPAPPTVKSGTLLRREKPLLVTDAAAACLKSLDALVARYATLPISVSRWYGEDENSTEELLGNAGWRFPVPDLRASAEKDVARPPLRDVWETWWRGRPPEMRDRDGLELLRAIAPFSARSYSFTRPDYPAWLEKARDALFIDVDGQDLSYPTIVDKLLHWLLRLHPPAGATDFLLDAIDFSTTLIPRDAIPKENEEQPDDLARDSRLLGWLELARYHRKACPEDWDDAHVARLWRTLRWIDEPAPGARRHRPLIEEAIGAFTAGAATEADVLEHILGPRSGTRYSGPDFGTLHELTGRKPSALLEKYPVLRELVDRCRERIVEVELTRGDLPTAASLPAMAMRSSGGSKTLVQVLRALGHQSFLRGWTNDSLSKATVFSRLVRISFPTETDTLEAFAAEVAAAGLPRQRLIELAVYAPQWASHVEHALQWPGLAEAAWWILAHTKDNRWQVDRELREVWTARVAERTPVSAQSLLDGAVDVAWFWRAYQALGPKHWDEVYDAAKFASGGAGHERARRFADAMLGLTKRSELTAKIAEKRHQDSVRALGLLPLAEGDQREPDLLERYEVIQEFLRTSRKFGAQRQESEKLAAGIALENLARTAGYPDPLRLQWAMETRAMADLAAGPVIVTACDVALSLVVDEFGEPELTVAKGGRPLKSIPAMVKKDPVVVELQARQREIRRQGSRVRLSLEQAMCRGDGFTGAELRGLFRHPVLAPMLRGLVFMAEGGMGYPIEGGLALEAHDGTVAAVGASERLRVAHGCDLLATGEWHLWQRECFARERIQPFKQVFRELYVLTRAEREEGTLSRRYAGHQVQPRQSLTLLGQRGWVNHPEEGVRRTFHDIGLSAWLTFLQGTLTPAEVEGLTIEGVGFSRYGEWKPLVLSEVPPRVFSEVMRDVDLVVSVAHRGGVDPEASASTVEMRASLIQETCGMLRIDNVRLQGSHALIEGALGSYSIHLGSAVVHSQPGGSLCIVPVHAQHRGRLFLPFADDDPKTAEVLSKILLLARDTEIKDPTILEQILA